MPSASRIINVLIPFLALCGAMSAPAPPRRVVMYLTGQHPIVPSIDLVAPVTHVVLAFMRPELFISGTRPAEGWGAGFFVSSLSELRAKFPPETKVLIAIGGWGDSKGFEDAARDDESRRRWAAGVADMVDELMVEGVDVDWEYPGGNGEDYKQVPNSAREWEIAAYPHLLTAVRAALGPQKLITAAIPGLERDMLAFTPETAPTILETIDFFNVMTYDMLNRRDNVTKHHSGVHLSRVSINNYLRRGFRPQDLNLGLAFYVKYVMTTHCPEEVNLQGGPDDNQPRGESGKPATNPDPAVGCPTLLLEDPETGADMGRTGAFAWHDPVPDLVAPSFERALARAKHDALDGSCYYWDSSQDIWWTWDDEAVIRSKIPRLVEDMGLGGVMAWGLGEDAPEFKHLRALTKALHQSEKDEL